MSISYSSNCWRPDGTSYLPLPPGILPILLSTLSLSSRRSTQRDLVSSSIFVISCLSLSKSVSVVGAGGPNGPKMSPSPARKLVVLPVASSVVSSSAPRNSIPASPCSQSAPDSRSIHCPTPTPSRPGKRVRWVRCDYHSIGRLSCLADPQADGSTPDPVSGSPIAAS